MTRFRHHGALVSALLLVAAAACGPSIALFSERAYNQATTLKVEALALMDKATEQFADHADEVQALRLRVDAAYEYARGRPKNELSTRQWEVLRDPERNLLGGFLRRWEQRGSLGAAFVTEAKGLIAEAFDLIIGLESGKIKSADAQLVGS
jgi:hypothetical protein